MKKSRFGHKKYNVQHFRNLLVIKAIRKLVPMPTNTSCLARVAVNANQTKNKNPHVKKNWEILLLKDVDSSIYIYPYILSGAIILYYSILLAKKSSI